MGSCCEEFLRELGIEVRPRQASVLTCVVLAGISEGLTSQRVLEGARYRYCSTKRSCGINYSGNPS